MRRSIASLIEADFKRWIFPLRAPLAFAAIDSKALQEHISSKILDDSQPDGFVAGNLSYARKDQHHLRRVLVLDPFAVCYLYGFVEDNRSGFERAIVPAREVFGPAFQGGKAVAAFTAYHQFRRRKYLQISKFGHFAHADVFNCFNSFYHHEVAGFIAEIGGAAAGAHFGQFLRELNAGVSVACFPQGLYPAKVIGNAYLRFIEASRSIRAPYLLRFLDDIVLLDKKESDVENHLLDLQCLLDRHHLALNEAKTRIGHKKMQIGERKLDAIKRSLVEKRESHRADYDDDEDNESESGLTDEEREYLTALIRESNVAQEDIELALTLLRDDPDAVGLLVEPVFGAAPHLLRGYHRFLGRANDDDGLTYDAIKTRINGIAHLPEHDLFWYARILIDHFDFDHDIATLLTTIYEKGAKSVVVRAAILEAPSLEYGFSDLKEHALRNEGNLVLVAAAMLGLAPLEKSKRNHIFKYVARQGAHASVLVKIAGRM